MATAVLAADSAAGGESSWAPTIAEIPMTDAVSARTPIAAPAMALGHRDDAVPGDSGGVCAEVSGVVFIGSSLDPW